MNASVVESAAAATLNRAVAVWGSPGLAQAMQLAKQYTSDRLQLLATYSSDPPELAQAMHQQHRNPQPSAGNKHSSQRNRNSRPLNDYSSATTLGWLM
jgi:hypothetical protein